MVERRHRKGARSVSDGLRMDSVNRLRLVADTPFWRYVHAPKSCTATAPPHASCDGTVPGSLVLTPELA